MDDLQRKLVAAGVTMAQLRSWAREHGMDVPTHGRLPMQLMDASLAQRAAS